MCLWLLLLHAGPLPLAASRAVGATLNSLVFHTYLPRIPTPSSQAAACAGGGGDADSPTALLAEWAPVLLRQLYERDVRRRYCQEALWLAPYYEMFGPDKDESACVGGA